MRLGGWQRLFVILAGVVGTLTIGGALATRPNPDGARFAVECTSSGLDSYVLSPGQAKQLLSSVGVIADDQSGLPDGPWTQYQKTDRPLKFISEGCARGLERIAGGGAYEEEVAQWWRAVGLTSLGAILLLFVIYMIGCAVRWVWMGFSPNKSHP